MKKSEKIVEMQLQIDKLIEEISRLNQLIIDLTAKPTYIPYVPSTFPDPYNPNRNPWYYYYPGNVWYYQCTSNTTQKSLPNNPPDSGLL